MTRGESSHYGGFHGDLPEVSDHFPNNGLSATFNAFYLSALSAMSELAEVIGDIHCRNAFRLRHARLRENFNSVFWDSARNGYADNPERTHHSVQANATAILARMADGPRRTATSIFFRENLSSIFVNGHDPEDGAYVSPHFAYYVLGALYDLELPELAENLIRQGWGHMLETGLRTCREYHNRKLDSFCHAWSASPGYFLSKNILGIRFPLAPNLDTVEIRPIAGSAISAASGIWPHPRGELHIEWRIKNGHRCIRVTPPAGVNVVLPQP
jgi:hypothetical protein